MNYQNSIRSKSLFLLLVFSLNTIVGFACALSVDMSFNTTLHSEVALSGPAAHQHQHGNKTGHQHSLEKGHDEANNIKSQQSGGDENNCCSDDVAKFLQAEKNITQSLIIDHPIFSSVYLTSFYYLEVAYSKHLQRHTRYFVRNYHPPIPDIRIAIQSFQI